MASYSIYFKRIKKGKKWQRIFLIKIFHTYEAGGQVDSPGGGQKPRLFS